MYNSGDYELLIYGLLFKNLLDVKLTLVLIILINYSVWSAFILEKKGTVTTKLTKSYRPATFL